VWAALALILALPSLALSQVRLLPAPREAHFAGETALPASLEVAVPGHDPEDAFAASDLEEAAKPLAPAHAQDASAAYRVLLMRTNSPEGRASLSSHRISFDAAMAGGNKDDAAAKLRATSKRLDQLAAKGTIHKNAASRKKSRLAKRLNKAMAASAAQ